MRPNTFFSQQYTEIESVGCGGLESVQVLPKNIIL